MLKTILEFILDENRLNNFFLILLFATPVLGIIGGYLTGLLKKQIGKFTVYGLLWGLTGSLISVLWWIYNLIMNHYGLDSVKGLLINLCLFVVLGCLLGFCLRRFKTEK